MNLQDYRQTFYDYSGKLSDVCRQLAFSAIAVVWLFKSESDGIPHFPERLVLPSVFVIACLTLDLLQYLLGSLIWRSFYRSKEKMGMTSEQEIDHSIWLEFPILTTFYLKVALLLVAYCLILAFLF